MRCQTHGSINPTTRSARVVHDGKWERPNASADDPVILRHSCHRGLLLLSSSCCYISVELASEFGRIVVLPHPDGLDQINSDRADGRD